MSHFNGLLKQSDPLQITGLTLPAVVVLEPDLLIPAVVRHKLVRVVNHDVCRWLIVTCSVRLRLSPLVLHQVTTSLDLFDPIFVLVMLVFNMPQINVVLDTDVVHFFQRK